MNRLGNAFPVILLLVTSVAPLPVSAAVSPNSPKVLLHVRPSTTKNQCSVVALANDCANVNTKGASAPPVLGYHVLVVADRGDSLPPGDGIGAVQIGISYAGGYSPSGHRSPINVFQWSLCATLQFDSQSPLWPSPGSGTLITWNTPSCQYDRLVCAGFFYLAAYAPGTIALTKRPSDNLAGIRTCANQSINVSAGALGSATFSAGAALPGCNPCLLDCAEPVAVQGSTWSGVKTLIN
jgi:hypothetical protein